ncbi:hypothetical protein D3C78_942870 [compost metagenome]
MLTTSFVFTIIKVIPAIAFWQIYTARGSMIICYRIYQQRWAKHVFILDVVYSCIRGIIHYQTTHNGVIVVISLTSQ